MARFSCATCHDPAAAFAGKQTLPIGVSNRVGTRNAPSILNSRFNKSYFWDGRADSLEEQAKQPLLNSTEMGMQSEAALVARLASIAEYRSYFRKVFPRDGITLDTVARAIAAYERTLVSGKSAFDRFMAGDNAAISAAQKNGWELFKGKAKCIECHQYSRSSPLLTDHKFYNTGVSANVAHFESLVTQMEKTNATDEAGTLAHKSDFSELGRYLLTQQRKDVGAFKTPTLRDIELTGPYMHNGSQKTLLDVVKFYSKGGEPNSHLDERMRPLNLTDQEINDVVEFLRALTSDDVLRAAQSARPQTRTSVPQ